MEGPRMVKEPLHPTPHQWMVHVHVWDAEERAKAQFRQKLFIISMSNIQELAEIGPPTSADALTRILHRIRKKNVSTKDREKHKAEEIYKSM